MINNNVINALYSLNSDELDSLKELITSTELYLSHTNELTLDIKKHIVRFVLISSIHVGGAIIYMPSPRKRYAANEFIKLLSDLTLSQKELSVEDIISINQQKNCLNQVKWPVYLLSIIKAIQIELKKINLTYDLKFAIIKSYLKSFVEFFAGRGRHFPSELCILSSLRNQMICDEFNGRNINELAWKFGVSTATVYKYIRQLRTKNKKCF